MTALSSVEVPVKAKYWTGESRREIYVSVHSWAVWIGKWIWHTFLPFFWRDINGINKFTPIRFHVDLLISARTTPVREEHRLDQKFWTCGSHGARDCFVVPVNCNNIYLISECMFCLCYRCLLVSIARTHLSDEWKDTCLSQWRKIKPALKDYWRKSSDSISSDFLIKIIE